MQRIWKYIYACGAIWCVAGGYRNLAPEHTAHFNMPWSFIVVGFFFFCVMPLAVTAITQRFGVETVFRRPSVDRSLFSKGDILQTYRVFWVGSALMSLGACLALPKADHRGVMMFWTGVAVSTGLFVGERIIYLVYAKRIAAGFGSTAIAGGVAQLLVVNRCAFMSGKGQVASGAIAGLLFGAVTFLMSPRPSFVVLLQAPVIWICNALDSAHIFPGESLAGLIVVVPLWFIYWAAFGGLLSFLFCWTTRKYSRPKDHDDA